MAVGAAIAAGSTAISAGKDIFSGVRNLFGGGASRADNRKKKRAALARLGFDWRDEKGSNPALAWNINNWYDQALDNVAVAYNQFGQEVVQLHNEKRLNNEIASNINKLYSMLENNQAPTMFTGQKSANQAQPFSQQNLINIGLISAGLLGGYWVLVGRKGKKK